ncbi:NAD(P)/FAD-dependent oxidoreductase [Lapillicoccus sp.]|uniref:NAD(P)/FAD-dependent oxidoreductase n=1 Tax=Lapillicoccus sp. TaxID=1909287 RepID=UPI00326765B8
MSETTWEVIVVGGGSAGLSAALMLGRARRRVLVLDGGQPRNRFSAHMHGVLGRDGTSPPALLEDGRRELERYDVQVRSEQVAEAVAWEGDAVGFTVTLASGEVLSARRLVVATGLRDVLPEIEGLAELWGRGVAVCPYCDAWEVRDARIGALATGPFSTHHAQLLRQWTSDLVYLSAAGVELPEEERRALLARGIRVDERGVRRVLGEDGRLTGVEMADGERVQLDAIFLATGVVAQDSLLSGLGAEMSEMFGTTWVTTDPSGRTSVPGVWAAGNVATPQANVPVAMGMGAMAGGAVNADLITEEIAAAVAAAAEAGAVPVA